MMDNPRIGATTGTARPLPGSGRVRSRCARCQVKPDCGARLAGLLYYRSLDSDRRGFEDVPLATIGRLPAGSPPLVQHEDGLRPVGVWFPASGRLLQIPAQTVVTARNLVQFSPAEK